MNTDRLNTAELTELHNATLADMKRARTIANIERRAATLFADGYSVKDSTYGDGYYVTSPAKAHDVNGDTRHTYKVRCSAVHGYSCTCPAWETYDTCKHLLAVRNMIEEAASDRAQADAFDAQEADRDWFYFQAVTEQRNFFDC